MGMALSREADRRRMDRAFVGVERRRDLRPAPAAPFTSDSTASLPAAIPGRARIDLCRLTVSLFGLGLYLGVPIAGVAYLAILFGEQLVPR